MRVIIDNIMVYATIVGVCSFLLGVLAGFIMGRRR